MNKQNISKMKFFFLGLENRFNENCDLFKDIKVTYKTGLKSFKGVGTFNNGKISYNFNGITKDFSIKELLNVISLEAEKYDSLVLTYSERGSELTISCDNKDVKMNTKEIETSKILDEHNDTSSLLNRNYLIKVGPANELLKAIGIMSKDGKILNDKIRKVLPHLSVFT